MPEQKPNLVDFDHPKNTSILDYLCKTHVKYKAHLPTSTSPHFVSDPYHKLGTHPDLVKRLWDEITTLLPHKCQWIVYGTPCLVHPRTGLVFGFAFGTRTYALRVPEKAQQEMYAAGAKRHYTFHDGSSFDIAEVGENWVLGGWLEEEPKWCLAAYHFAGKLGGESGAHA